VPKDPIVAITAFNIDRYTTVEAFLDEYRQIGLDAIELNGRVRQEVIDELVPYIERGEIRISSLHIFCPRPDVADLEDLNLASPDEAARKVAARHAMNTISTAQQLGATAVVVHPGHIPPLRPLSVRLKELYRAGEKGSARYAAVRDELVSARRAARQPYLEAGERSLVEMAEHAARKAPRVRLGLENNVYRHLLLLDEYDAWFERYEGAPIGLWFDIGHAQVQESFGLGEMEPLLQRHGHRLLGLHLHDCRGVDDHRVPGTGEIDFTVVNPHLRPDVLRVLEYGGRGQPLSQIAEGVRYLRGTGVLS
jgi:sugar phosphate isomerase/epimerase